MDSLKTFLESKQSTQDTFKSDKTLTKGFKWRKEKAAEKKKKEAQEPISKLTIIRLVFYMFLTHT